MMVCATIFKINMTEVFPLVILSDNLMAFSVLSYIWNEKS